MLRDEGVVTCVLLPGDPESLSQQKVVSQGVVVPLAAQEERLYGATPFLLSTYLAGSKFKCSDNEVSELSPTEAKHKGVGVEIESSKAWQRKTA